MGVASKYDGSPDMIERDLLELAKMFDPTATHTNGDPGGLSPGNLQNITVDDATAVAYANTSNMGQLS